MSNQKGQPKNPKYRTGKPCRKCGSTEKIVVKRKNPSSGETYTTNRCIPCSRKQVLKNNNKKRKEGYFLKYQQNNREHLREYQQGYYTPDKHRMRNGINAKRVRQATLNTPENKRKVKEFYANKPDGMEVDHIYPIKGKTCSGLHVWWNLQYLPISDNRSKSNKISEQYQPPTQNLLDIK